MAKSTRPLNQVWCIYNHLPGGQVVAIHFEDIYRNQKQGEGTMEVLISSKAQVEGFKQSPQVALNIMGKISPREVLQYQGPSLEGNPKAAKIVIEWARERGIQPIRTAAEIAKDAAQGGSAALARIEALEKDVAGIKDSIKSQGATLGDILAAVKSGAVKESIPA